jgi:hypothetical protein
MTSIDGGKGRINLKGKRKSRRFEKWWENGFLFVLVFVMIKKTY